MSNEEKAAAAKATEDHKNSKAEIYEAWKLENPEKTEEDFENQWGVVEAIFGI